MVLIIGWAGVFKSSEDVIIDMRNVAGEVLARNASSIFQRMMDWEKIGLSVLAVTSYAELLASLFDCRDVAR